MLRFVNKLLRRCLVIERVETPCECGVFSYCKHMQGWRKPMVIGSTIQIKTPQRWIVNAVD